MNIIFIVTEQNADVATGHLMECIVCAEELIKEDYIISFWINGDANVDLKKWIPCKYQEYEQTIVNDYKHLFEQVAQNHPKAIIFNLRYIDEDFLKKINNLVSRDTKIICIDEFGHRDLSADIIINPMIDSYYWDYGKSKAKLYCGAEYLILSRKLEEFHSKEKIINKDIKNIVITMGGVDPQNYTLDLVEIIPQFFPDSTINIIIGGGNQCQEEIQRKSVLYKNIKLYRHVSNLPKMMYEADLLICAGGNTLHEAANVGSPTIIIPSMPHEKVTAAYFENKGFGYVVNTDKDFCNQVLNGCIRLKNIQKRRKMSERGKEISDGLGWKRVVEIIKNL